MDLTLPGGILVEQDGGGSSIFLEDGKNTENNIIHVNILQV